MCGRYTALTLCCSTRAWRRSTPITCISAVPGSDLWRERLAFRDALRHDPVLVVEYTELKARLLRQVWWAALWRHG